MPREVLKLEQTIVGNDRPLNFHCFILSSALCKPKGLISYGMRCDRMSAISEEEGLVRKPVSDRCPVILFD